MVRVKEMDWVMKYHQYQMHGEHPIGSKISAKRIHISENKFQKRQERNHQSHGEYLIESQLYAKKIKEIQTKNRVN